MEKIKTDKNNFSQGKRKLKNDIIFIAALLAVVSAVGFLYFFLRGEGNTVTVTVDGEFYAEYSLSEDRTVEIRTGNNLNILVVKNGEAYVESASCPDGICSSHKPISRDGESIICLPNRVVITVSVKNEADKPDIIV